MPVRPWLLNQWHCYDAKHPTKIQATQNIKRSAFNRKTHADPTEHKIAKKYFHTSNSFRKVATRGAVGHALAPSAGRNQSLDGATGYPHHLINLESYIKLSGKGKTSDSANIYNVNTMFD